MHCQESRRSLSDPPPFDTAPLAPLGERRIVSKGGGELSGTRRKFRRSVAMQFCDLGAQYRAYRPEIDGAIAAVLERCVFIQG